VPDVLAESPRPIAGEKFTRPLWGEFLEDILGRGRKRERERERERDRKREREREKREREREKRIVGSVSDPHQLKFTSLRKR